MYFFFPYNVALNGSKSTHVHVNATAERKSVTSSRSHTSSWVVTVSQVVLTPQEPGLEHRQLKFLAWGRHLTNVSLNQKHHIKDLIFSKRPPWNMFFLVFLFGLLTVCLLSYCDPNCLFYKFKKIYVGITGCIFIFTHALPESLKGGFRCQVYIYLQLVYIHNMYFHWWNKILLLNILEGFGWRTAVH